MQFAPKSLFGRFFLIIVIPIIILQIITTYIFYQRHWDNVSERMKNNVINNISVITTFYGEGDTKRAMQLSRIYQTYISFHPNSKIKDHLKLPLSTDGDLIDFKNHIAEKFPNVEVFYFNSKSDISVLIEVSGGVLKFDFSNKKIQSPTTLIFILWVFGSAFLLLGIAIVFMKNQVRSIMNLSIVAERFGKGLESPRFNPSGAKEVKKAGWAFIRMQRRIKRQIQHRTELLSHISHDLRTPLTRIKLALEMMKEAKKDESLKSDIKEMEVLISSYLDFAKEEGNEENKHINLEEYIGKITKKFKSNKLRVINRCPDLNIYIKKEALKRAINNLINNALKHCKNEVKLTLKQKEYNLFFIVEDDGNGIPKKHWKTVFKPFFKTDNSTEGYGLGLAIVKTIVYNHGGIIKLDQSSLGGLKVVIKLPI